MRIAFFAMVAFAGSLSATSVSAQTTVFTSPGHGKQGNQTWEFRQVFDNLTTSDGNGEHRIATGQWQWVQKMPTGQQYTSVLNGHVYNGELTLRDPHDPHHQNRVRAIISLNPDAQSMRFFNLKIPGIAPESEMPGQWTR